MGQRQYRRDSQGKFAGSGGGSMITYGKAGGFANSAFRARTSASNQKASVSKSFGLGKAGRAVGGFVRRNPHLVGAAVGYGALAATGVAIRRSAYASAKPGPRVRRGTLTKTVVNGQTIKSRTGFAGAGGRGPVHIFN